MPTSKMFFATDSRSGTRPGALAALALAACIAVSPALAADIPGDMQTVDPHFDPVASSSIWNGAYAGL